MPSVLGSIARLGQLNPKQALFFEVGAITSTVLERTGCAAANHCVAYLPERHISGQGLTCLASRHRNAGPHIHSELTKTQKRMKAYLRDNLSCLGLVTGVARTELKAFDKPGDRPENSPISWRAACRSKPSCTTCCRA